MDNSILSGNWVDFVIVIVLIYFASEAWRVGFWSILADFFSFFFSLLIALRTYFFAAGLLRTHFSFSHSVSNALGFLMTAVLAEAVLGIVFTFIINRIPHKVFKSKISRVLSFLPAFGEGLIL